MCLDDLTLCSGFGENLWEQQFQINCGRPALRTGAPRRVAGCRVLQGSHPCCARGGLAAVSSHCSRAASRRWVSKGPLSCGHVGSADANTPVLFLGSSEAEMSGETACHERCSQSRSYCSRCGNCQPKGGSWPPCFAVWGSLRTAGLP